LPVLERVEHGMRRATDEIEPPLAQLLVGPGHRIDELDRRVEAFLLEAAELDGGDRREAGRRDEIRDGDAYRHRRGQYNRRDPCTAETSWSSARDRWAALPPSQARAPVTRSPCWKRSTGSTTARAPRPRSPRWRSSPSSASSRSTSVSGSS